MAKILEIDDGKGLLFPANGGKATGAVRIGGEYFEVVNSSTTEEGTHNVKTLNVTAKKLGGRKSVDIHLRRSGFKQENAPSFISNEFVVNNVKHQVVGWAHTGNTSGRALISLAVNEVVDAEFMI